MKCPYCNNEMIKGLIHSPQELNWIKGEKRKFFTRAFLHKDSIVLSELSMMKGSACVAYNCPNCKKIVIDYADGSHTTGVGELMHMLKAGTGSPYMQKIKHIFFPMDLDRGGNPHIGE